MRAQARCHECQEVLDCGYCRLCGHWLCRACKADLFARFQSAWKQMLKPRPNCCGPVEEHRA